MLVAGARERNRGAFSLFAAGLKFPWPMKAADKSSSRVGATDIANFVR